MSLDEGHYYNYCFFEINCGKVSLWLWTSMENSGIFFSFVATMFYLYTVNIGHVVHYRLGIHHVA